jgi:release factor glutamine methyltransferase
MAQDFAARGIESARLDADLLVGHVLRLDRVGVFLALERELTDDELARLRALVTRRRASEPIAYLVGKKEFFGRVYVVSPAVLVPRPDTETLVERALALLPMDSDAHVLDLCTGSGAIAIALAAERPSLRVDATDLSSEALAIARENVAAHSLGDRVTLFDGDLFAALPEPRRYALVCANPPYIAERDARSLPPDVIAHEPHLALFGGADGLDVVRRILAEAPAWLDPGGTLLVELGAGQGDAAVALARRDGAYAQVGTRADLAGIARVLDATVAGGAQLRSVREERVVVRDEPAAADLDSLVGERVVVPDVEPPRGEHAE